jgi:hypothetical protein
VAVAEHTQAHHSRVSLEVQVAVALHLTPLCLEEALEIHQARLRHKVIAAAMALRQQPTGGLVVAVVLVQSAERE